MKVGDLMDKAGTWFFRYANDRQLLKRNTDAELDCYNIVEDKNGHILWCAFVFKSETFNRFYFFNNNERSYREEKVLNMIDGGKNIKKDIPEDVKKAVFLSTV